MTEPVPTPLPPPGAPPIRRRGAAATLPALFVGALLGFIAGYFAAGAARPSAGVAPPAADAPGAPAAAGEAGRIASLKTELLRDPENPKLWAALGNAYYDREDWDRAVEAYEKALRKAPKDANLLSDLGAAYRNRGEFRRAIAAFEKARKADPNHWQSLLNLVLVHAFDARDAVAAQRFLDELTRRYPEIPNTGRIQEQISRIRAG